MERAGCAARLRQPGALGFGGGRLRRGRCRRDAILGRSVTEAARDALAWVLSRDGERQGNEEVGRGTRSEEHTSELQSRPHLVCRLLLEKKKKMHERLC